MRDKLIELLAVCCDMRDKRCVGCDQGTPEAHDCKVGRFQKIADYLIASGVTVQEWISVKERLPENGTTVLVYRPSMEKKYMESYYLNGWHGGRYDLYGNEVITHWLPIPMPPKMEVEE